MTARLRRTVRMAAIAAAALLLYAGVGFLLLPRLLRGPLEREIAARLGRETTLGRLRVNPFAISVTADGLSIRDRDNTPLLRWETLLVDFDPIRSAWRREWSFHEIHLAGAAGRLALLPGGTLNIDDIIERLNAPAPGGGVAAGPPPVVSVGRLRIEDTSIAFIDRSGEQSFTTTLGPLRIDLRDFTTRRGENNAYVFRGATEAGETFSWSGRFELDPLRSEGEFSLGNVTLAKYHPYYRGVVPFDIRDGIGDLRSRYRFAWGTSGRVLALEGASAALRQLKLSEHDKEETVVEAPLAQAEGGALDLLTGVLSLDKFSTSGGHILLRKSKEGRVNLLDMILPFFAEPAGGVAGSPSLAASALPPTAPAAATLKLGEMTFTDYTLDAEDLSPARAVRVRLDQIALTLHNVDNVPGTTAKGSLDLRWNGAGTLHADGDLSLVGLAGRLKVAIAALDVTPVGPYVEPVLDLRVTRGRFFADGGFQANLLDMAHPRVAFQGNVRLDDFASIDGRDKEDLLRWGSVRLDGVDYSLERDRMRIGSLTIAKAQGTLVVAPDGSVNLARVLRLPAAPPAPEEGDAGEKVSPEPMEAGAHDTTSPPDAAAPATKTPAADEGDTRIARAQLKDSAIRFVDRSMTPPAELLLQKIDGTLAGLSSRPGARAEVHLQALCGETAPVRVDGQVDPLGADVFSDLALTAQGIDLLPLAPYSARYLGYDLDRAKLSLDMRYRLEQHAVAEANVLTADPLLLGPKTDSPDATHLPVRLGLALLRDRHGVIELDVPVEGNLDDPKFRLGRVILRALVNIFTKLVTSPFTLLARAFAGRDDIDLSLIEFAPGSAALAEGERPRLETLVKGLTDRPGLSLAITGRADAGAGAGTSGAPAAAGAGPDVEALRHAKLDDLVRAAKWKSLRRAAREATPAASVVVDPGEEPRFLKSAWKEFLEGHPAAATDPKPETPEEIEARLLPRLEVGPADLTALAAARAGAVRDHLVAAGIEATRLEVKTDPTGAAKVTLELQ